MMSRECSNLPGRRHSRGTPSALSILTSSSTGLVAGLPISYSCIFSTLVGVLVRSHSKTIFGAHARKMFALVLLVVVGYTLASSSFVSFMASLVDSHSGPLLVEVDIIAVALLIFWLLPRQFGTIRQVAHAYAAATDDGYGYCNRATSVTSRRRKATLTNRRRGVQIREGLEELHKIVTSLTVDSCSDGARGLQETPRIPHRAGPHDYHTIPGARFLLPVEVAACCHSASFDVSEHLQRLLQDRWAVADSPLARVRLPPIAE